MQLCREYFSGRSRQLNAEVLFVLRAFRLWGDRQIRMRSISWVAAACFALFVFAGYYKAADVLSFVPLDLTLLFWLASGMFCLMALWRRRALPPGSLAILGVFLLMTVGLHWPEDLTTYAAQKELRLFSLSALAAFGPLVLLQGEDERRVFVYGVALLGVIMAALAVMEIMIGGETGRPGVFNTNPILLGRASGFAVIVLFLVYWQRQINLAIFLVLVGITFLALLASESRGPLVALLVTMAGVVLLCVRASWGRLWNGGTVLASVTGLTIAVFYIHSDGARLAGRFMRLLTGNWGGSETSRWSLWKEAGNLVTELPLGVGWGRMTDWIQVRHRTDLLEYPHNIFLEIALEAGWPAAIGFLLLVSWALAIGIRRALDASPAVGSHRSIDGPLLFAAPAYWLLCAQVSGDVNDNRPLWAMIGMVLAARGASLAGKAAWRVDGHPAEVSLPPEASLDDGKRVLHVSSAHRVSDGRIAQKEAQALSVAGYDVTVLGLARSEGTTLPDGPKFVEYDTPASRVRRFLVRLPWLLQYCLKHRFDVYHLHDPDLIPVGFILKLWGRRVIYDVHESYPMVILDRDWIPQVLRPSLSHLWRMVESAFVRWADLTIAAHDPVKRQFHGGNVITVHNYPIEDDLAVANPRPMAGRACHVIYHGDLTEQRGLLTMIDAIAKVELDQTPVLRLAGSLTPTLQRKIAGRPGFQSTNYLGWLGKEGLVEELGQARAGLVLLHPMNNYKVIRPNKLYEYMAAGLPVIASDFPHWREVVAPANCGLLVDPLDSSAIARAIEYLLTHPEEAAAMGERGRKAVSERYNWQSECNKFIAAYEQLFGHVCQTEARREA